MSFPLAPPSSPSAGIRVVYPEVVLKIHGAWVRALPTRVGEDMYIATKIKLANGYVVENVTKMPMPVYEQAHAAAVRHLGPRLYQQYLGQLPAPK